MQIRVVVSRMFLPKRIEMANLTKNHFPMNILDSPKSPLWQTKIVMNLNGFDLRSFLLLVQLMEV
jgi:hypothetical protein